jgi:DNA-binding response OmpR family regulator
MCATVSLARPTVLVLHEDAASLDALTQRFEAGGFEVITAITGFRAQADLEGERAIDLVAAPWDARHPVGGELYRWALHRRYDLRDGFVFLSAEPPPEFDRLVAGRCLWAARPAELVRLAMATVRQRRRLAAARDAALEIVGDAPTLLLADDEPALLMAMADLLGEAGYAVVRVDSGHAAITQLVLGEPDAVVVDWNMDDGHGADVYRWIQQVKPWLAERVVFLTDGEAEDATGVAPGRPMFRKGQDARALRAVLGEIVRQVRGDGPAY